MTAGPRFSVIPAGAILDPALKGQDLRVLCLLGRHTNDNGWCRRSQVKMAKQLDCSRSTVQTALRRLEDAGWVERSPIDGKSQGLNLTPAGSTKLAEAMAVIESFEASLLARIPAEHRDHLLPALHALWNGG